ncbi:MAG: ACP S-malonyltransferase [Cohaesibacter sp.]|nr:ACP S-malonyltransferase [Cohaesibacter sp.]
MSRKSALVIAPGRGTYNKEELGYLHRFHSDKQALWDRFDQQRQQQGQDSILALDGSERFSLSKFTRGDNASALIHSCAYGDFLSIDQSRYDIVAVIGNSMGWYTALACSGAVNADDGFTIVNTMGRLMQEALIGGQLIYPFVDENWQAIEGKKQEILALIEAIDDLYLSIDLGGMLVLAGSKQALAEAEAKLPVVQERFPMRLQNHAAFHSPLQNPVAELGRNLLGTNLFHSPSLPMVDGRGHSWLAYGSEPTALHDYTLDHQVVEPYLFTRAIQNALREFCPDVLIILGPGKTLGGAVAQCLIECNWQGLASKQDFLDRQSKDPILLSMGMEGQRAMVTGP